MEKLRTSQMEFEILKLEISRIIEDAEIVETSNQNVNKIQLLTDVQVDEALNSYVRDIHPKEPSQEVEHKNLINKLKVLLNIRK